jgi:hypothetical protein
MKKFVRILVFSAMALCLTQAAFAAAPVSVQLDGKELSFADAEPVIANDRTYLPLRAVFEAMGAEVAYDNGVVTATRDGKTIAMTIGSTEARVTEDGKTTALQMDVAPYIDPAVDRTYVPVRFAAQALGANVGWDGEKRAVVIVDTEKLVDSALEGKTFTYMDKLSAFSDRYSTGIWNTDMKMDGKVVMNMSSLAEGLSFSVPATVEAKGISQDQTKLEVNETFFVDLSALKALVESDAENAELAARLQQLKDKGFTCAVRGDISTGKLYLNFDLSALQALSSGEESPFDSKAWYLMDMKALSDASGMDYAELISQSRHFDAPTLVRSLAAAMSVDDAANGYSSMQAQLKQLVSVMADDAFVKNGNVYTSTFSQTVNGAKLDGTVELTMKGDAVTAYGVKFTMLEESTQLSCKLDLNVDAADKLSGKVEVAIADSFSVDFAISGGYSKGSAAPVTEPPAGAEIVDLMQLSQPLPVGTN